MRTLSVAVVVICCVASAFAQKLTVKITGRQDNTTNISSTFVVPNYGVHREFQVRGATLALQLPDGRVAVVNCESKFEQHFAGPAGNRRSCHVPLVDEIQAEFSGSQAKLTWVVSIDGKTTESETYKILAVLPKASDKDSR
jgi:hypothetical protein